MPIRVMTRGYLRVQPNRNLTQAVERSWTPVTSLLLKQLQRNSRKRRKRDVCPRSKTLLELKDDGIILVRAWAQYAYPPSPEGSPSLLELTSGTRPIPLSQRLRALQNELLALENELADPANPLLQKEREEEHVDPGELIRGLVDVRTRLDKIKKGKEGRARLVSVVVDGDIVSKERASTSPPTGGKDSLSEHDTTAKSDVQVMVDIDHRVGELEHVIGSSSASLDEVCYTSFHPQKRLCSLVCTPRLLLYQHHYFLS